ncbi:hypothetical protein [Sphaerimonospora mesophila]|uniref:hypothetical protein n=1 Tax=Sphaerimonospora mesophila TaxID=37483 RepID=UPI0006E46B86
MSKHQHRKPDLLRAARATIALGVVVAILGIIRFLYAEWPNRVDLEAGIQSVLETFSKTLLIYGGGVVALAGAWLYEQGTKREYRQRLEKAAEDPRQRLEERIQAVSAAFAEAAALMGDLQRDLAAQQVAREAILAQAEEQQRLLSLNQEQAENIRHILLGETKATIWAERRQQWFFFALGALVSIPIGALINLLVP